MLWKTSQQTLSADMTFLSKNELGLTDLTNISVTLLYTCHSTEQLQFGPSSQKVTQTPQAGPKPGEWDSGPGHCTVLGQSLC